MHSNLLTLTSQHKIQSERLKILYFIYKKNNNNNQTINIISLHKPFFYFSNKDALIFNIEFDESQ